MPNNKKILKLLDKIGPIYLSSANIHNEPTLTFHEAKVQFKNDIKIHLNYNKENSGLSSTVIKAKTNKVIRQGDVKIN
jgi:tRNA A37 threonylcarbamoyladenosine synthetase subunit TsaC/SUA5/YrdC